MSIARALLHIQLNDPFLGRFLALMGREVVHDGPMHIRFREGLPVLLIPESADQAVLAGSIRHEALHVLLGHPEEALHHSDHFLVSVAADLVVNHWIELEDLPDGSVHPSLLSSKPTVPQAGLDAWMAHLKTILRQPGHSDHTMIEDWRMRQERLFASHRHWWKKRPTLQLDMMTQWRALVGQQLKDDNPHLAHGSLEEALLRELQPMDRSSRLDWRHVLRQFGHFHGSSRLRPTLRRPSKRYGTTPGLRLSRRCRLMVAVDTSASIGRADLELFFSEIRQLWRLGAEIEIVECDDRIRARYSFKGQLPQRATGGGGTDFNPPLQLAREEGGFDGLIYFTDGLGEAPIQVAGSSILWIVVPSLQNHVHLIEKPGQVVFLS